MQVNPFEDIVQRRPPTIYYNVTTERKRMKPIWILDSYLLERSNPESGPEFAAALEEAGCDVSVHVYDPRSRRLDRDLPELADRPALAYGSFPFVKHVLGGSARGGPPIRPGSYARLENLSFHAFAAHIGDLLLNDDFHILPFGELLRRPPPLQNVFIRPDRVTKSFTGFCITPDRHSFELSCLEKAQGVGRDELVIVASAKSISLECRYVIADGRVVAGSTYGWDGFVPSAMTDPRCDAVAGEVARREWQADTVYTCDVALWEGTARVVELNSFSCAGLYACDTKAVAEAVTACIKDEFGLG